MKIKHSDSGHLIQVDLQKINEQDRFGLPPLTFAIIQDINENHLQSFKKNSPKNISIEDFEKVRSASLKNLCTIFIQNKVGISYGHNDEDYQERLKKFIEHQKRLEETILVSIELDNLLEAESLKNILQDVLFRDIARTLISFLGYMDNVLFLFEGSISSKDKEIEEIDIELETAKLAIKQIFAESKKSNEILKIDFDNAIKKLANEYRLKDFRKKNQSALYKEFRELYLHYQGKEHLFAEKQDFIEHLKKSWNDLMESKNIAKWKLEFSQLESAFNSDKLYKKE